MSKRCVVLLSGGLDSATLLYIAKKKGFTPVCLVVEYGQRHRKEIEQAKRIARQAAAPFEVITIKLPWQGSSLIDKRQKLPRRKVISSKEIPSTYVPARNIIFLSFAVSYAEAIGARDVFIGANAIDYSGYPDCRPKFFQYYQKTIKSGMKSGVKGRPIKIHTPLIHKTKAQIIRWGQRLGVPYAWTWSCYEGGRYPCGTCDSCVLRAKGFAEAGVADPLLCK